MEDDALTDDSLELDSDDIHISSDDFEDDESGNDLDKEEFQKPAVKKVASIMNKLLTEERHGPVILSKLKLKKETEDNKEDKDEKDKFEKLIMVCNSDFIFD